MLQCIAIYSTPHCYIRKLGYNIKFIKLGIFNIGFIILRLNIGFIIYNINLGFKLLGFNINPSVY